MKTFFVTIGLFLYTSGYSSKDRFGRFGIIDTPKTFVEQLRDGEHVIIAF
jgi:hypothetical protein